ncbi:hypothetical protein PV11_03361 [Exophiala sideris]|uniref:RING-type domain-containing protein n=2 Tax=Exophiala sideris TaxID=1016849 RepID=A0A0D1YYY3_9EURO|nr:hypothetical protein PV11_03361 [Exophiala sideris]
MPQAPNLSLSSFLNPASSSSSRKRSHAEITRSESRSASPDLPSKRPRISPPYALVPTSGLFSGSPTPAPPVARFERDGFDYRRPIMSTRTQQSSHAPDDVTIDLTADSDVSTVSDVSPRPALRRHTRPQSAENRSLRAPPFTRRQQQEDLEVIDLSEEDSDFHIDEFEVHSDTESERSVHTLASSPEVQFLHERPASPGSRRPEPPRPSIHAGTLGADRQGSFNLIPDLFRRGTQFMFGNMQQAYDEMFADRFEQTRPRGNNARPNVGTQGNDTDPELVINLNYRRPAFALGGLEMFDRTSETPQVVQEPYKAPPAAKEGFIRTFGEEDVILCPRCGDELAVGNDDTKKQVWVVKACGHVFCGECAASRSTTSRGPKKIDKKRPPPKPAQPFKECKVDGCSSKLTGKHAMFPIYL